MSISHIAISGYGTYSGVGIPPLTFNECPDYDIKQPDGEALVMLDFWERRVSLHCHRSQVNSVP